jgi:outer membrane protein OmpA-like peptidoglycan-associated protein
MKKFLPLILFMLLFTGMHAQYKAGMKFYDRYDYYKAIDKFKCAIKPGSKNYTDALTKLADSYRMVRDFKNAATYYKMVVETGQATALTRYYYGVTLKSGNRYEEALVEFNAYLKENPTDIKAKNAVKSCTEMKAALSVKPEYVAQNLIAINTKHSEFCPVVYGNELVFISYQKNDLVNFDKFEEEGIPFLSIYYSTIKNDSVFSSRRSFSKIINSDFHDGPVCFPDSNTIYFTHVEYKEHKKNKGFVNRPQIFFASKKGKKWQKATSFPYNSPDYCIAHPAISADGNSLYFSSDMPGGQGGMDIWVCKRDGNGNWGKPENLGFDVNTSGNEEFPYLRKDGILFFSSDGLPGFGGLDIFSARQIEGKWVLKQNEGIGMNSFADDFGVFFIDNTKGYVSSNRDGGMGSDDIYKFTYTSRNTNVEGTVLYSKNINDIAKNVTVLLEDDKCNVLTSSKTNEKGLFHFDNLTPGKKYMVKVDEKDPALKKSKRYYYAEKSGNVVRVTAVNEKGEKYVFTNLPADANSPSNLNENDVSLAGNLLYGQNPSSPVPNAQITLVDENGKVIGQTITNFFGSFAFDKVSADDDFNLEVTPPEGMKIPSSARIVLTNKNGKEIRVIKSDKSGKYKFNKLASDNTSLENMKVDEGDLIMDLKGKILDPDKKQMPNTKVSLLNDRGETLLIDTTDETGKFTFKKLSILKDYTISFDKEDERLKKYDQVYLATPEGQIVQALIKDFKNGFQYKILASQQSPLKEIYVDDPWLDVLSFAKNETVIQESVTYGSGEFKLNAAGLNILDKIVLVLKSNQKINIEIGSHTDSRGNDDFNLILSKKRATFAADYIISKGINSTRVKGIGYGETKIINKCVNNVTCGDDEHAKNRRTEFRIINTDKK